MKKLPSHIPAPPTGFVYAGTGGKIKTACEPYYFCFGGGDSWNIGMGDTVGNEEGRHYAVPVNGEMAKLNNLFKEGSEIARLNIKPAMKPKPEIKLPDGANPPPDGYVFLGRGRSFKIPNRDCYSVKEFAYAEHGVCKCWYISQGGFIGARACDYAFPADSEIVKLNLPKRPTIKGLQEEVAALNTKIANITKELKGKDEAIANLKASFDRLWKIRDETIAVLQKT